MKITSNKSGGNGLINAPEYSSCAGALNLTREEVVDGPAISRAIEVVVALTSEEYNVSVEWELRRGQR